MLARGNRFGRVGRRADVVALAYEHVFHQLTQARLGFNEQNAVRGRERLGAKGGAIREERSKLLHQREPALGGIDDLLGVQPRPAVGRQQLAQTLRVSTDGEQQVVEIVSDRTGGLGLV